MNQGARQVEFCNETAGRYKCTLCVKYCTRYKYGDAAKHYVSKT